jgi:hypothetical protein
MARCRWLVLFLAVLWASAGHAAQEQDEVVDDTDPTKPIAVSLRNEYYNLLNDVWTNVGILRADRLFLRDTGLPGHLRGILFRADLPFPAVDTGLDSEAGLGDLYAQVLLVPQPKRGFTVAYGTGLSFPTATGDLLGTGKWVVKPLLLPLQYLPKRKGLAFLKVQDWLSFAGDGDREDVHFLTIQPTLVYRLTRRFFALVDSEAKVDWERNEQTSCKSGILIGRMFSPRIGAWVKGEVPWGQYREGDWILKATVFLTRY